MNYVAKINGETLPEYKLKSAVDTHTEAVEVPSVWQIIKAKHIL